MYMFAVIICVQRSFTMYKKMYLTLFNAITDALEHIDADSLAAKILIAAQQKTEEIYISQEDDTD